MNNRLREDETQPTVSTERKPKILICSKVSAVDPARFAWHIGRSRTVCAQALQVGIAADG